MQLFRQGDVLLRQISGLPSGVEKVNDSVLARGEATGHSHRIEGGRVFRTGNGQLLVQVEKEAELVHEEHRQITIPQGTYEVVRQIEYNPIAERQVSD